MSSRDTLRCFNNVARGTCTNTRTIPRRELEARVLRALRERFLADEGPFAEFCAGFREEQNRMRMEQRERLAATRRELDRVTREIKAVVAAIKKGVPGEELKTEMAELQARKTALLAQLASMEEPEPLLHPSMSDLYRMKVEQLATALEHHDEQEREAARDALRGFITAIVIPPGDALLEVRGISGRCSQQPPAGKSAQRWRLLLMMVAGAVTCHWRHMSWRLRHDLAAEPRGCAA